MAGARASGRTSRWRAVAAGVLVVALAVLVPVSVVATWARDQLLDTDAYVRTVGPVLGEPAVRDALAGRAGAAVERTVAEQSAERLPPALRPWAGTAARRLGNEVSERVAEALGSERATQVWVTANRRVHETFVAAVRGEARVVEVRQDALVLSLDGLTAAAAAELAARGIDLTGLEVPPVELVLLDGPTAAQVQRGVRALDGLAGWLPWVTVAVAVGAMALGRRRAVVAVGVSVALGAAAVVVAAGVLPGAIADDVGGTGGATTTAAVHEAVVVVLEHVVGPVGATAWPVLLGGLTLAVAATLAGLAGLSPRRLRDRARDRDPLAPTSAGPEEQAGTR